MMWLDVSYLVLSVELIGIKQGDQHFQNWSENIQIFRCGVSWNLKWWTHLKDFETIFAELLFKNGGYT